MTNEEAINVLNDYDINFERHTAEEIAEAHEMAIKALEQQPSENEKIIRISKGTLKARTGKYVIYDVEWLKEHFNTTEAKIYGQPSEDCISRKAVFDSLHSNFADGFDGDKWWNSTHVLDVINKAPSVNPQPSEHTEEHTETHACDCISRKEAIDALKQQAENMLCWSGRYTEQRKGILIAINIVSDLLSVTPQSKEEQETFEDCIRKSVIVHPKKGHWIGDKGTTVYVNSEGNVTESVNCSECGEWLTGSDEYICGARYCPKCGAKMQEMQE